MKKKVLLILLEALFVGQAWAIRGNFSAVCSSGQTLYYQITSDSTVEVIYPDYNESNGCYSGLTEPSGDLVIPRTVSNNDLTYFVTSIGNYAFGLCDSLTSVTIPNTVTNIDYGAFQQCSSLTSINIPNSVTSIGSDAFSYSGLISITWPNSISEIPYNTFSGCSKLTSVTIPNTVTSIETQAFHSCSSLTSITIPESVTSIERYAFAYCTSLNYVYIPETVTNIGGDAFEEVNSIIYTGDDSYGAYTLYHALDEFGFVYADVERTELSIYIGTSNEISIPNTITTVREGAFDNCNNFNSITIESNADFSYADLYITIDSIKYRVLNKNSIAVVSNNYSGNIVIPKTITYGNTFTVTGIDYEAFYNCTSLNSISLPNSVTYIRDAAFRNCSNLTSIIIPDSVTEIGWGAFMGCNNLKSLTFGSSVKKIDRELLADCDSLKNIICRSIMPPYVDYDSQILTANGLQEAILYSNATLTYPKESGKLYRKMQPWCNFDTADDNVVVKDTVFVYDTVHYVVNNKDTLFIYDTIQHIISSKDTVYIVDNNSRSLITATSANTKMGIAYGSGVFVNGSKTEIVAIEKYGYHFTKWSDGNTENPRFVEVTSDCSFTAEFEVNNYSVLAEANAVAMGKVEGGAEYAYLSRTQLKAIPNEGYKFTAWSDGETENPRNILVYSDTTFTAVFMAVEATVIAEFVAQVNIYTHGRTIVVENATDEIRVYDAMGRIVGRDVARNVCTITINNPGVYIVKTGDTVKRVMVK